MSVVRRCCWLLAVIAGAFASTLPAFAAEIAGTAHVVDGDTLYLDQVKVRLHGVDAPETDQVCLDSAGKTWACGIAARDALALKIGHAQVTCESKDKDRYGRIVALCRVGGEDIDKWLVREGWALAFVRYSQDYLEDEHFAERQHAGMWAGAFINPWDWRHRATNTVIHAAISVPANSQKLLLGPETHAANGECLIKGNVNRRGDAIYHVPGQRYYEKTRMDKGLGERWFCTEEEAQAAGWRKSSQ